MTNSAMNIGSVLLSDRRLLNPLRQAHFLLLAQAVYGILWLEGASWKILVDGKLALNYDGLSYWASRGSEFPVLDSYKWLLDNLILPNIEFFLPIVFLVELTIGLLFFFGKYIRVAAVMAIAQTLAIMLSVLNAPHEWKWSYLLMLLVAIIFFFIPTRSIWPTKIVRRLRR
jgi:thiosulfate dehydrogenase [quinone] large subunit